MVYLRNLGLKLFRAGSLPGKRGLATETSSRLDTLKKEWDITIGKTDDNEEYTIRLNNINMKTPMKNLLKVQDETLAYAIANEWKSKSTSKKVDLKTMHLTTLSYEAIDNPFKETEDSVVDSIIEYLKFDTVRLRDVDHEEFLARQTKHWDPLVGWFEHRFDCHLPIDYGSITSTSSLPKNTQDTLVKHLRSHKRWPLIGIRSMTQNLKSFVLASCLTERFLDVERVVDSARLETKFQTERWSKVEWEHDIDEQCMRARVAAACLFYHLCI